MVCKIVYGMCNVCVGLVMFMEQVYVGLCVGMEIVEYLFGNVLVCVGMGQGLVESVVFVFLWLVDVLVCDFVVFGFDMCQDDFVYLFMVLQVVQNCYCEIYDLMEVFVVFGGFEIVVMVGVMLVVVFW